MREIYALGFRNPFRFSFDSTRGDLYVGDVGQNDLEEVDIVVRGGNYGWPIKEGTLFFHHNDNAEGFASREPPAGAAIPSNLRDPIAQYDTHHEGHSVIGGFVYRGRAIRDLVGRYVFGDFSLLFKFPLGPHDYGRIFWVIPGGAGLLRSGTCRSSPATRSRWRCWAGDRTPAANSTPSATSTASPSERRVAS